MPLFHLLNLHVNEMYNHGRPYAFETKVFSSSIDKSLFALLPSGNTLLCYHLQARQLLTLSGKMMVYIFSSPNMSEIPLLMYMYPTAPGSFNGNVCDHWMEIENSYRIESIFLSPSGTNIKKSPWVINTLDGFSFLFFLFLFIFFKTLATKVTRSLKTKA